MKALSRLQRYALAMIACGVAFAVAWAVDEPAVCFLVAVTISHLFLGRGPGLVVVGFSVFGCYQFFLERTFAPAVGSPGLSFLVFLTGVVFIAGAMEIRRRLEESRSRAEEARQQAQADLAHVNRVTTVGALTAVMSHDVTQPMAAAIIEAHTCSSMLDGDTAHLEEARAAVERIVSDVRCALDTIEAIRLRFKKGAPERDRVDVNEVIRETIALWVGEAARYAISVRTELTADRLRVMGDRVELQQVMMNLIMNGIDAMKDVDGRRELAITSRRTEDEQLLVCVSDTGVGLPPGQADQIFKALFTTKRRGIGLGLSISRSIVESHGGRLWAAEHSPRGASLCLTLPARLEADAMR
jgi:C4-dicarboxylate-specific signal transduction histidine kinase